MVLYYDSFIGIEFHNVGKNSIKGNSEQKESFLFLDKQENPARVFNSISVLMYIVFTLFVMLFNTLGNQIYSTNSMNSVSTSVRSRYYFSRMSRYQPYCLLYVYLLLNHILQTDIQGISEE